MAFPWKLYFYVEMLGQLKRLRLKVLPTHHSANFNERDSVSYSCILFSKVRFKRTLKKPRDIPLTNIGVAYIPEIDSAQRWQHTSKDRLLHARHSASQTKASSAIANI